MRIQASSVQLTSQHLLVEQSAKTAHLQVWIGQRPGETAAPAASPALGVDQVSLSGAPPASGAAATLEEGGDDPAHPQLTILRLLLERMTGRRILVFNPGSGQQPPPPPAVATPQPAGASTEPPTQNQGWGMISDYHESYQRTESTAFTASGTLTTGDGRRISFAVEMSMSQEFHQETQISLKAGDALKDPLVLNFTGAPVTLSTDTFSFDLNRDGRGEQINFVGPGSGFLVLDKNGDGVVNDGSELFGPTSGNGYQELASYDSDHNGWLDEADPVFRQLQLWSGETADTRQLTAIGAKGIGAIYLGRAATPFTLNNASNELQGQVGETGIYAREDGSVGTMQQVDLVT